jgi:hypothetical protein
MDNFLAFSAQQNRRLIAAAASLCRKYQQEN